MVGRNPSFGIEGCPGKPYCIRCFGTLPLFTVILMACHLLEEALVKVWHGQSFASSFSETVADPRAVFATMLLMFVVLIPFFFANGLI